MKNVMERSSYKCVKFPRLTLMRFCGLSLALSLFCFCFALIPSPASAVSFQFENSFQVVWSTSNTLFRLNNGSLVSADFLDGNRVAFIGSDNTPGKASVFAQLVGSGISKGRVVQLNYAVMYNRDAVWSGFSCDGECMILDQSFTADSGPLPADNNYARASGVVWVQILTDNYWALSLRYSPAYQMYFRYATVADIVHDDTGSAIIDQTEELKNSQQQTTDAVNNQTEQQKNQYEQDKQEEADREQSSKDDAGIAGGIFNFSVLNPFAPLLHLFNPGNACVSIPVLSSWLHTEQTSVCPFFPSGVRSIVTPVLGISSMMLLFGFVMRWLGGNSIIHLGGD